MRRAEMVGLSKARVGLAGGMSRDQSSMLPGYSHLASPDKTFRLS